MSGNYFHDLTHTTLQHAKQAELQFLSDSSLALGHSSSQSLLFVSRMITWTRSLPNKCQISNFITDTYRTLGSSLKTVSEDLNGHVDALQRHIMASPSTSEVRPVVRLGSVLYRTSDFVKAFFHSFTLNESNYYVKSLHGLLSTVESRIQQGKLRHHIPGSF